MDQLGWIKWFVPFLPAIPAVELCEGVLSTKEEQEGVDRHTVALQHTVKCLKLSCSNCPSSAAVVPSTWSRVSEMRLARGLSCSTSSHTWPEVTYPLTLHTSSLRVSTNWNLMCWSWWEEERSCLRVLV